MNNSGATKRRSVLVTITPYNEQEKRVLNNTTPNIPAPPVPPAPPAPPVPPPLPLPSKAKSAEDSVEMQSIESFKLKETPNPITPKPPSTYFPVTNNSTTTNGSPRHVAGSGVKPQINGKEQQSPVSESPKTVPSPVNTAQNLKPASGKVAIRIGAYEGEVKQPSRLDFLSQQSRAEKNGTDDVDNGPVVSRLQNELAATLQRSNLRRKTEGEGQPMVKPIPENAVASNNETTNPEPGKISQSNVEKLASALNNKVTIKINPENSSR